VMATTLGVASAQIAPRDQVAAANSRALEALRAQIVSESIGPNVTVAEFLSKTGTGKKFNQTLARAQQIGGPRWLDDQTCQVRLELPGPQVAKALVDLATLNRLESPVPPDVLAGRLKDWDRRTFSAIGTSTGAGAIGQFRPIAHARAWDAVADDARRAAVANARKNAVAHILDTIKPIPLGGDKKVADALADKDVAAEMEQWLAQRPVTQVEFRDDLQVRMTLAVPGAEMFEAFRASAGKHPEAIGPVDEAGWYKVRDEFVARLASTSCRGSARAGAGKSRPAATQLPRTPPDWIERQLDADGASNARGSRLKAARAAEADATEKLRTQLEQLSLAEGVTIGDAVRQDKHVADAVDRALGRAQSKVQYVPEGGARATVTLELNDLWEELQIGQ
jgi:hypothetical protein